MKDTISRQAAVDALKAQADTMRTWVERYAEQRRGILTAVNIVEDIKPADVVPVVRCRDCKHWDNGNLSFECPWDYGRHGSSDEDDFCSYGERKESAYEI